MKKNLKVKTRKSRQDKDFNFLLSLGKNNKRVFDDEFGDDSQLAQLALLSMHSVY